MSIFKGLGRFQSPLEQPEAYKLDLSSDQSAIRKNSDTSSGSGSSSKSQSIESILKSLMHSKPVVVLEHLKSARSLPLTTQHKVQEKIVQNVTQQLNQVKIGQDWSSL